MKRGVKRKKKGHWRDNNSVFEGELSDMNGKEQGEIFIDILA